MPIYVKGSTLNILDSIGEDEEKLIEYFKYKEYTEINFFDERFLSFDVTLALINYRSQHPITRIYVNSKFLNSYLSFLNISSIIVSKKQRPSKPLKAIGVKGSNNSLEDLKNLLNSLKFSSEVTIFVFLDLKKGEENFLDDLLKSKTEYEICIPTKLEKLSTGKIYINLLDLNLKIAHEYIYLTDDNPKDLFSSFESEYGDRFKLYNLDESEKSLFKTILEISHDIGVNLSSLLIKEFLKELKKIYGYDFSEYSREYLDRRIEKIQSLGVHNSSASLALDILNNQSSFDEFFLEVSINVTSFFRNREYLRYVKEKIIPYLKTFSHIKIWSAGCSTGEEAYSLGILLEEAGILHKSYIYATDINSFALNSGKNGIFSKEKLAESRDNFKEVFPDSSFDKHIEILDKHFIINEEIKKRIIFHKHSLVDGGVINEFNLIVCKNVMIYFSTSLIERTQKLLYDSLRVNGFLVIGSSEYLKIGGLSNLEHGYNIFKKSGR